MSKIRWKKYFNILNTIYTKAEACELLLSNGESLKSHDGTFNRKFRGIIKLNKNLEAEICSMILEAEQLHEELINARKLPHYFPTIIGSYQYITVKNRKAISSRQYKAGKALLAKLYACENNELIVEEFKNVYDKVYGKDFISTSKNPINISVFLDVDRFNKYHQCETVRVREETCDSYYCSMYISDSVEPIRESLGFKFTRSEDQVEIHRTPKRKKRTGKYSKIKPALQFYQSQVYVE